MGRPSSESSSKQATLCECGCGQETPLARKTDPRRGHVKGQPLRFVTHHNFRGSNKGESNPAWKGDEAGYTAMHAWVWRHKERTGRCEECGRERYTQFANLSGELRRDVNDYRELCVPCHRRLDLPSIMRTFRASLGHAL